MKRRHYATPSMRAATRKATKQDYSRMVAAATQVVVTNGGKEKQYRTAASGRGNDSVPYVLFRFPFWVKFASDFPKGHVVAKDFTTNTHKINAVKLLDWLYSKGHSTYNSRMLVAQTNQLERLIASIDRAFEKE